MPRREQGYRRMELLPLEERLALDERGRAGGHCQEHWYMLVAEMVHVRGRRVLDVGAGTGYGSTILFNAGQCDVLGIDPLPAGPVVEKLRIEDVQARSFDYAVAMDVIEHVENDIAFLREMLRVAKRGVFLSTPNWHRSHCRNEFHVREYTVVELLKLLIEVGAEHGITWYTSDDDLVPLKRYLPPPDDGSFANFGVYIPQWSAAPESTHAHAHNN